MSLDNSSIYFESNEYGIGRVGNINAIGCTLQAAGKQSTGKSRRLCLRSFTNL